MKTLLPLLCLALLLLVGCTRLTQENFNRVEDGMTYDEVVRILGEPADSKGIGAGPLSASSATWEDDQARVNIKFLNGKVQLKAFESKVESKEGG